MLSEETIQELKQILKEEYGQDVDLKEASEIAYTLVSYFDLLAKICQKSQLKDENYNEYESREK